MREIESLALKQAPSLLGSQLFRVQQMWVFLGAMLVSGLCVLWDVCP